MFASAPFFGEQPTAAETAQSHRMLLGALACGILVPLVGAGVSSATARLPGWVRLVENGLDYVAGLGTHRP